MDIRALFGILMIALFLSNSFILFELAYIFICFALVIYTFLKKIPLKYKALLTIIYVMIMSFQTVYNTLVVYADDSGPFASTAGRLISAVMVLAPFIAGKMVPANRANSYMPSVQDITVFTFNEMAENAASVKAAVEKGRRSLSKKNLEEIVKDLPRHNSFRYVNKGSLTDEYFEAARATLGDPKLYIVISNTGSPASEIISVFTRKRYNHASLSFDRELKTIVSYNGGETLYPPGLNREMIKYFNKKKDSSLIVYSLPISAEKKKAVIDKIEEINEQGSAYNLFGLALKLSFKPNIMFCSQFIYNMLKLVDLNYFEKKDAQIKPSDLTELDYDRKLSYEYKMDFGRPDT
ncbi:MAG: energy-coupling factor transporter transmembrane protein EcfT [Clostridiales Family XIII bacterium]|jgi:hypothetical protein|nr:energy-coupling factor transporter transmembrane protein EcfT [Clostridiales Family XIII bacterium]